MNNNLKILDKKKNSVILSVDLDVYSLIAVKKTCFVFSDKYYFFIKKKSKNKVFVEVKTKDIENVDKLVGEFFNELLNNSLREEVLKNNKKIRELIVSRALFSAVDFSKKAKPTKKTNKDEDPLGIMQSWEERYEK